MRCVIFDLDGTLADTSGDLIAAANVCFDAMGAGVRLDPGADAGVALRGGRAMLTEGLGRIGGADPAVVDRWYPALLEAYGGALDVHTRMYPGAAETVEALRRDGYAVGVCTNKPEALAQRLLAALGVRDLFGALIGADTLATRKPDVAPYWAAVEGAGGRRDASLLVGDSDTDRKTAAAAGVPCILVTFAPGGAAVRELAPEGVIDAFAELPAEVRRLIG
ncbi:HAD-IA family hydrolase [Pseudoponticoccus marisrubri]|uniref:phosphoglycolate phosphatase n=1 Tax=Pseudoponticoccus marisrubri TaxID=1685382 RepID=A0A0W7WEW8_9RHOB|nr:HAD-IA family hydrolase [Pseudoponticoccus marisrubri]KUF09113.1 haloacid dehalogenase [Pseudoponticoccus marisrubri]